MASPSIIDRASLTGTYTFDPSHTRVGFVARHAMVTKVRGSFNEFEGTAFMDANDPAQSSARVSIKAASIDTRNEQRDGHLRSNDFLAMAQHPEITFVSTSVRQAGEDTFDVIGDLTVRGVTRSITIPIHYNGAAVDPYGNLRIGLEGSTTINRRDWGVNWNAALEAGGVLVSDNVVIEVEISAIKNT